MPLNSTTRQFTRAFSFVDEFDVGDEVTREALDQALDDLAGGLNGIVAIGYIEVGDWSAASGAFPTSRPDASAIRVKDAWRVSNAGTVSGQSFLVGDYLVALKAGGGVAYTGNWLKVTGNVATFQQLAGRAEAAADGAEVSMAAAAASATAAASAAADAEAAALVLGSLAEKADIGPFVSDGTTVDYALPFDPVNPRFIDLFIGNFRAWPISDFTVVSTDTGFSVRLVRAWPVGTVIRGSLVRPAQLSGDGGSDNTLVQNAADLGGLQGGFDWLAAVPGRKLLIDAGTHTITETLTLNLGLLANAEIETVGGRATILVASNVAGVDITGPLSTTKLLTANYVPGSTSLSVADLGFAPEAGDELQIVSDAVDGANRDRGSADRQYRTGERVMLDVGCTATNLVLKQPLRFVRGVDPVSIDMIVTTTGAVTVAAGEILTQAGSDAVGTVMSAVTAGTTVRLTNVAGLFDTAGQLTGSVSGALGAASVPVALDDSRDESVVASYTTAMQARVVVMRRSALRVRGALDIAYPEGNPAWRGTALTVSGLTEFEIAAYGVPRGYGAGLSIRGTPRARVLLPRIDRLANSSATHAGCYGISLRADNALILGGTFAQCRHGVTSGGERIAAGEMDAKALLGVGRSVGVHVTDCLGRNFPVNASPFDTHHDAQEWVYQNCRAADCAEWAFTIRGPGHKLLQPVVRNSAQGIFAYTEYNAGDADDDYFVSRKSKETFTSVEIIAPDVECRISPLRLSHATATVRGGRIRAASHKFFEWSGDITIDGAYDWKTTDFDGAATITTQNATGMLQGSARNARAASVFPVSTLRIANGAHVRMDGTGGLGTARLSMVDDTAEMIVDGVIEAVCPAGTARILSTTGAYSGPGEIRYSIAGGAAADSVPVDTLQRQINLFSTDGRVNWPAARDGAIPTKFEAAAGVVAFMRSEVRDHRGDLMPNAFRRVVKYIRETGSTDIIDVVAEKSINTTGAAYCLRYLAKAETVRGVARDRALMLRLADLILSHQHLDPETARYGGFALAPKDGTASAYNAAMCGLGLLAAYRVTDNPRYLIACRKAAIFLATLNAPNAVYTALYGVTPIPALAENAGWAGFCDQISAGDTITTSHSTWNLLASKFLQELFAITGDSAHGDLAEATRDWGARGVTGYWDYFAIRHSGALPSYVTNNWFATGLTVSDGAWHRRGEAVVPSPAVHSGTCTGATTTTITLAAGASAVDDAYTGMAIQMTSGAANAKGSIITHYVGATKVATLRYPFPTTPSSGDGYKIGWGVNTIGSDQMEYGIEALFDTGYDIADVRDAYDEICSWPNVDTGDFGTAYDSAICWTGYFRVESQNYGGESRAYGTQYDVQGIGPLLPLKAAHYPDDFAASLDAALQIPDVATLVDEDWQTIWSADAGGLIDYSTVGVGTVKGAVGLGILETW